MRAHDVSVLSAQALSDACRELAVSVSLSHPNSPLQLPLARQLAAVDAEIVGRNLRICGCGMATSDDEWMDGHLFEEPDHEERDLSRYLGK